MKEEKRKGRREDGKFCFLDTQLHYARLMMVLKTKEIYLTKALGMFFSRDSFSPFFSSLLFLYR